MALTAACCVAVSFGWAEHVGELELWVEAPDEATVFAEALRALHELLGEGYAGEEWREVTAHGEDRAALLAAWIEELCFLAETEGFVPEAAEHVALEPASVRARVRGRRGSPPHLVKAVTYHRLAFGPSGGGWRAVAVLDV
jgi:SHS2 domain-containing protein